MRASFKSIASIFLSLFCVTALYFGEFFTLVLLYGSLSGFRFLLLCEFDSVVYHDLAVDGLAHLDVILVVIMHGKGIYLLIGQTCTPHSLDFRQDVGNALVYVLALFAEILRKEFIV